MGLLYLGTSFAFFAVAGLMALLMRAELARPGLQFLTNEQYNQLFTIHGTVMLLLFATPMFLAFGNFIVPLQIGAPDVAFPRLNAFSYWLFLFGGSIVVLGFATPGGAADFGWFAYAPLNSAAIRRLPADRRQLAGMGHELPAAAAQFHQHSSHPLGAAGLRPEVSPPDDGQSPYAGR